MKIPDIFNQSLGRLIFGSGCHVWYAMRVCLCFNPDLNDSLFDELIKRPNIVKYRWFLGISGWRVTCRGVNIYWMQSLRLETEAECCVDTRQCVLGVRSRQLSEPGERRETQSVSDRSESRITCVTWPITCHQEFWAFWWLVTTVKCDSNSHKLSSISLSGCDKRNSPIKLFLTSALRVNIKQWGQQRQCVSVTRDIDNNLRERRALGIRSDLYQWRDFMAPL